MAWGCPEQLSIVSVYRQRRSGPSLSASRPSPLRAALKPRRNTYTITGNEYLCSLYLTFGLCFPIELNNCVADKELKGNVTLCLMTSRKADFRSFSKTASAISAVQFLTSLQFRTTQLSPVLIFSKFNISCSGSL